jgi:hypothetical protein
LPPMTRFRVSTVMKVVADDGLSMPVINMSNMKMRRREEPRGPRQSAFREAMRLGCARSCEHLSWEAISRSDSSSTAGTLGSPASKAVCWRVHVVRPCPSCSICCCSECISQYIGVQLTRSPVRSHSKKDSPPTRSLFPN